MSERLIVVLNMLAIVAILAYVKIVTGQYLMEIIYQNLPSLPGIST